jgi:cytochrome c553
MAVTGRPGRAAALVLLAAALVLLAAALATTALVLDRRGGETVDGALVYVQHCAFCHDVEGAIGAAITASTLASRGDEEALYRYLRLAMPYEAPGSLTDAEYRATARHLLETRGLAGESVAGDVAGDNSRTGDGR